MFRVSRHILLPLCAAAVATLLHGCGGGGSSPTPAPSPPSSKPTLPKQMIAGYTGGASPQKVSEAVKQGVNVLFWSFMHFRNNSVVGDKNMNSETIGPVYKALVDMGRKDVLHILSFGGWEDPHNIAGTCGKTPCSGEAYAASFRSFNEEIKANISGFPGFAGIDWDYEGMDELNSSSNEFNMETYEAMLNMSKSLSKDFIISMVPPQSYFNCRNSGFDNSLRHAALSDPSFTYAGLNAYAALYAKCPDCFDLVMVQLYEGYSVAGYDLYWDGRPSNVGRPGWPRDGTEAQMKTIIQQNMQCLAKGWTVEFNGFWGLANQTVTVPPEKIVMGLANEWAAHPAPTYKTAYFLGGPSGEAWCEGVSTNGGSSRTLGFMYWVLNEDLPNAALAANLSTAMSSCKSSTADVEQRLAGTVSADLLI